MKIISVLSVIFTLLFFFSISSYSQEREEINVIAKGCKRIQDNLELKNCLAVQLSKSFSYTGRKLKNELNPGVNRFKIHFKVKKDRNIEIIHLNTVNPDIIEEFENTLNKFKILEPGYVDGEAVDVPFNLPLTLNSSSKGPVAVHKMSRLVFLYDESNTSKLRPVFDQCIRGDKKEDSAECMNTYLVDGTFNSVEAKKISPMLQDGLNKINVKIVHNGKNEITDVIPASGNSKLDEIFKEKIEDLLQNVKFVSPSNKETSYSGELMLVLNYLKQE